MKANPRTSHRGRFTGGATTLLAQGEPMLWLTGGMLAVCLGMIVALLAFIIWQGLLTFWPKPLDRVVTRDGQVLLGELDSTESFKAIPSFLAGLDPKSWAAAEREGERLTRRRYQTGRKQVEDSPFRWIEDCRRESSELPEWGIVVERWTGGRFYGILKACELDGKAIADTPAEAWREFQDRLPQVREIRERREQTQSDAIDPINKRLSEAERQVRQLEATKGSASTETAKARAALAEQQKKSSAELSELRERIDAERREEQRARLVFETAWGTDATVNIGDIVRAYPPNQLSWRGKLGIYLERWWEFVSASPREGNSEGGVFPALIGTLVMTLLMSAAVVPLGVLAAIYLREYAKPGWRVSMIRIAINNLAGVPSIVYGVFGLGFFVYICGGSIDRAFFWSSKYPVFGQGGVLWASLTLALLTLPIVIVATEESLSAVPNSMREGSYACGASQWQTIRRIILPRAMPGVMTGLILAVARGAGEVAPLMLVGVIEYSPQLPIDSDAPFIHMERPFMHLGFSIYYAALKSPNSEASKPLVFTTTLLLIVLIATLNLAAIWLRGKLRRRFQTQAF